MLQIVILVGLVLLVAILMAIFRISRLLNVAKGTDKEVVDKGSNSFNAILFIVFGVVTFGLFFWYSIVYYDEYTPPVASEHGVLTDGLFWTTMWVTGIVFIITHILLFWFSYKYQYKKESSALFFPHNNKLEVIWTVVPAIVLTILVFTGLKTWNDITDKAPEEAEVVEIMGYQFAWKTRYPGNDKQLGNYDFRLIDAENQFGMDLTDKASFDDFTPREIHIPKGQPVLFKIRARDVLHSVYAPHFRLKMDAVPGMQTNFWFVPTKSTAEMREETGNPEFNYEIACTEICGKGHFSMRMLVVVDEPEDYKKWLAEQESWLSKNETYLAKVPANLKEEAKKASGLNNTVEQPVSEVETTGASM
ncbi:cytochrome c oxidase subunit II [Cytophagales bacterium LB-30]|uniref:Cytochrome c oxidase subunit 2 n=1 Tax=Shiella aurantiaca TaxID=3058365 RepID=A0ABT8F3X2_9BACT|nr:cytochrome c oxidase subunit II [Shiella aurantiaca]MDN4165163.1 cytochrome c oxidase subunit II [Shiella aurantiaca]